MNKWIGTANQGYSPYAIEELRRLFERLKVSPLAAGEVFMVESEVSPETFVDTISKERPAFLRHIQPVDRTFELQGNDADLERLAEAVSDAKSNLSGKDVAVHVRRNAKTSYPFSAADTKAALDRTLTECGAEHVVQSPDLIVAVYAAENELHVGIGSPKDMLSDWPGGAIRFQREEGQISRAKFKLLEAEREFGLDYANFRAALDIGAAPGGWTSLLLERGVRVTAIDPGELHPSLLGNKRLTYLKKNASDVKFQPDTFDLLVCDMSWSPMQMSRLVLDLEQALVPGATAIVTVKLMHRKPLQTIREVKERMSTAFVIRRSKQLFHNREEITLYMTKKDT
ncbi:SAM-dependent methyltransferase [Paenibacillus sp. NPDC058071]|uniref:SAM-dependent methyltransferase n=1 Tax=Paenibacillus sp. NPDC058071 TaxID=3346326 RepID=UPI0036DF8800